MLKCCLMLGQTYEVRKQVRHPHYIILPPTRITPPRARDEEEEEVTHRFWLADPCPSLWESYTLLNAKVEANLTLYNVHPFGISQSHPHNVEDTE